MQMYQKVNYNNHLIHIIDVNVVTVKGELIMTQDLEECEQRYP